MRADFGMGGTHGGIHGERRALPPDPHARLMQAALALLADNGQTGGLQGLVERFREVGLGNVIASWIGSGDNMAITPAQIQEALGEGQLQQIAEETGFGAEEVAQQLSDLLPSLIDGLTPAGHMPQEGLGDVSALLEQASARRH